MLEPLLLEYLMGKREYECTLWSNRACRQCMVHSGCEPSAVDHTFWTSGGLIATTRALLLNTCASPWTKPTLEEAKGPRMKIVIVLVSGLFVLALVGWLFLKRFGLA